MYFDIDFATINSFIISFYHYFIFTNSSSFLLPKP